MKNTETISEYKKWHLLGLPEDQSGDALTLLMNMNRHRIDEINRRINVRSNYSKNYPDGRLTLNHKQELKQFGDQPCVNSKHWAHHTKRQRQDSALD